MFHGDAVLFCRCCPDLVGCIFCGNMKDSGTGLIVLAFWSGLIVVCVFRTLKRLWHYLIGEPRTNATQPSVVILAPSDQPVDGAAQGVEP